jgi:hypothetical protein
MVICNCGVIKNKDIRERLIKEGKLISIHNITCPCHPNYVRKIKIYDLPKTPSPYKEEWFNEEDKLIFNQKYDRQNRNK